jgi:hypothetical protein
MENVSVGLKAAEWVGLMAASMAALMVGMKAGDRVGHLVAWTVCEKDA